MRPQNKSTNVVQTNTGLPGPVSTINNSQVVERNGVDDEEHENDFSMYELNHETENKTQLHDDGGSGGSKMFGDDQVDVLNENANKFIKAKRR